MRPRVPRVVVVALVATVGVLGSACVPPEPELRILFLGNSYTTSNDLPAMVVELAGSADITIETGVHAPGGWWLRDHARASETVDLVQDGDWDVVVLQEQSMVPADAAYAESEMFPAAIPLANRANGSGAKVVLFETWGHLGGSVEVGHSSYSSMQTAVTQTYESLGQYLGAEVAPSGQAWSVALGAYPGLTLHQADGSHPTMEGTYLAAVVITATILDVAPSTFGDGPVTAETAEALRQAAGVGAWSGAGGN